MALLMILNAAFHSFHYLLQLVSHNKAARRIVLLEVIIICAIWK